MGDEDVEAPEGAELPEPAARRPGFRERAARLSVVQQATIAGGVAVAALGALCGWLGYQTYQQTTAEAFRQSLVQVARQGAINLTTIDYRNVDSDVQRILDSASGQFYDEFSSRSAPFIDVVKKAESTSVGTVTEAGIESVSGQEGQVLVAVSVTTTNRGATDDRPRYWRMRLTVTRHGGDTDGGDTKVSKVEFVP